MNEDEYEAYESVNLQDGDAFSNVAQGLTGEQKTQLVEYWQEAIDTIERIGESKQSVQESFKSTALPLARIKKVMKTDSDVRMISAEAPILFAKGCDVFITELTMRAWIHAEESKRRTLQRSDIAMALQKSDMFDFLIDIVPREDANSRRYQGSSTAGQTGLDQTPLPEGALASPPQQSLGHNQPHDALNAQIPGIDGRGFYGGTFNGVDA